MGVGGDKKRRSGSQHDEGNACTLMAAALIAMYSADPSRQNGALCAALKSEYGHVFHYGHETLGNGGYLQQKDSRTRLDCIGGNSSGTATPATACRIDWGCWLSSVGGRPVAWEAASRQSSLHSPATQSRHLRRAPVVLAAVILRLPQ